MIRMYMLLTLFTTVLALLLAKALRRPTLVRYLLIGIVIYLGMLTQYFYVIYAFYCVQCMIFTSCCGGSGNMWCSFQRRLWLVLAE